MFETSRKLRLLPAIAAVSALACGLASCGDTHEPRAIDSTPKPATSSAVTADATTPSSRDVVSDGSRRTTPEVEGPTVEPRKDNSPTDGQPPSDDEQPRGDEVGLFEQLPEDVKATLDPAPLTEEELQRGKELPGELIRRVLDGRYEEACELPVQEYEGGIMRLDAPDIQYACVRIFDESVRTPEERRNARKFLELTNPDHLTLRDVGNGTAEFFTDGEPLNMTLVRLDDGTLRLWTEGELVPMSTSRGLKTR